MTVHDNHHVATLTQSRMTTLSIIHAQEQVSDDHRPPSKLSNRPASRPAKALILHDLLHLHVDQTPPRTNLLQSKYWKSDTEEIKQCSTSKKSPKEVIAEKWREMRGSSDWDSLFDPLHPWLRREIVKYGELAQATYDAFDFDPSSEYCGSCRYNRNKFFEKLGLTENGYTTSKYIYAMSHEIDMPQWLLRSINLVDIWSKDSNWIGYVAVSNDEETRRIGRRDIVVAWRGTVAPSEWYEDIQGKLEPFGRGDTKVEHGFLSIYTSKSESTRYNKSSASEQVMKEVTRLVQLYRENGEEEVSLTITGHSLGGALALLNAYEAASTIPNLPVTVISFGAPRVGNIYFRDELQQLGVKTLRVVIKQDVVPRMLGLPLFNEGLQKLDHEHHVMITRTLKWVYIHLGVELKLDVHSSPYLKRGFNLSGFHSLETYLHLVDGFVGSSCSTNRFRWDGRRDVALVNKACDMLVDELKIPPFWYQLESKGLVRLNAHGRGVKLERDPEDIPSPGS